MTIFLIHFIYVIAVLFHDFLLKSPFCNHAGTFFVVDDDDFWVDEGDGGGGVDEGVDVGVVSSCFMSKYSFFKS